MSRRKTSSRWIEPQDFCNLRRQAGMTRIEAAKALDVTGRTIQNWETGGARIPWNEMQHLEQVFAMSRLWRQEYTSRRHQKPAAVVLPFPAP